MTVKLRLLRRRGRRSLHRLVFVSALAVVLAVAPGASGLPAALDIQYTIAGTPGTNNWYVSNVTVRWTVSGETRHNCTTHFVATDSGIMNEIW